MDKRRLERKRKEKGETGEREERERAKLDVARVSDFSSLLHVGTHTLFKSCVHTQATS